MSFLRSEAGMRARNVVAGVAVLAATLPACGQSMRSPDAATSPPARDLSKYLVDRGVHSPAPKNKEPVPISTETIVERLLAASARRSAQLRGFRGTRQYNLQYRGLFGTREATMQVVATYTAPDQRSFQVVSQTGSKLLLNRVLLKLLDSERDALRNQKQVELTPANYDFNLLGTERLESGVDCYVLSVKPRKNNQFLYQGKIWVDANDFAVARMEGQPAKSPSFWVKDTAIDSNWGKLGDFWLIQHNRSVSHIRMGGMATLNIDYTDYQITGVDHRAKPSQGQQSVLPDPSSVTPQR